MLKKLMKKTTYVKRQKYFSKAVETILKTQM